MSEQTSTTVTAAKSSNAMPMNGVLSGVVTATDKNGKPYAKGTYTMTKKDGSIVTRLAMAFGRAYEMVKDVFVEGATVGLYGKFEGGTFGVIGLALPPKEKEAAAA